MRTFGEHEGLRKEYYHVPVNMIIWNEYHVQERLRLHVRVICVDTELTRCRLDVWSNVKMISLLVLYKMYSTTDNVTLNYCLSISYWTRMLSTLRVNSTLSTGDCLIVTAAADVAKLLHNAGT